MTWEAMSGSVVSVLSQCMWMVAKQIFCVQDPTCLCGIEACINKKLLGERRMLEEGSIVVLEQAS